MQMDTLKATRRCCRVKYCWIHFSQKEKQGREKHIIGKDTQRGMISTHIGRSDMGKDLNPGCRMIHDMTGKSALERHHKTLENSVTGRVLGREMQRRDANPIKHVNRVLEMLRPAVSCDYPIPLDVSSLYLEINEGHRKLWPL